jgi:hypothetical protein
MNYADLITETVTELSKVEKAQKLVAKQKRVQFLRHLKTGEATTQAQAGGMVGWKLRYSQSIWQSYRRGGLARLLDSSERWYAREAVERRDGTAAKLLDGVWSGGFG